VKPSITYRISAVFLSALVLFSSLSFSIEKHFCEGEIQSSFFDNAADLCSMQAHECHSDEAINSCCSTSSVEKTNCCIDTSEFIQGITIEVQTQTNQTTSLQLVVFLISDFFNTNLLLKKDIVFPHFSLKLLLKSIDIGLLFQVFKI